MVRYLCGTILLLIIWPLLILFDVLTLCTLIGLFIWAEVTDGPVGIAAGKSLTERVFQ
jgi:hypothetical protein